jgi:hypothetical protein
MIDLIFIAIIIFGAITSYTDIKFGKIKNITILIMLFSGLVINIFFTKSLINFFNQSVLNIVLSLIFGFLLYFSNIWSEGDAKLFFGYAFLIPVTVYKYGYIQYFQSLVVLINTFVPASFFYLLSSFFQIKFDLFKKHVRKSVTISSFLDVSLFLFSFSYIFQIVSSYLQITLDIFSQTLILFFLIELSRLIKKRYFYAICVLLSIVRILFSFHSIINLVFIKNFVIMISVFQGLRALLLFLVEFSFTESININNLKAGMTLGERIVKSGINYTKKHETFINISDILSSTKNQLLDEINLKLTEDDVKKIQKLNINKKLSFKEIKIVKNIPFAPFLFIGVIVTYLMEGSLLYYFSVFFNL